MELNTEYPEENEEALIQSLTAEFERLYQKDNPPGKSPATRGTHPKTIACVRAEFAIEPHLSTSLQAGLFQSAKIHPAWVRFSQTRQLSDKKRDNRSLSIKVMEVPGEKLMPDEWPNTQDFLMRSTPTFYARTVGDFLDLICNLKNPLKFFFPHPNPLKWRLKELRLFITQLQKISNPLEIPYWGEVPFRFGKRTIKFQVKPHLDNFWKHGISPSDNFLHEVIGEFLKNRDALFDFFIQFQLDPEAMPIEDATVEWDSPLYKVATLRIPSQDIDAPENRAVGEKLSFNPWHALPEHQPLGGLNRARKNIYPVTNQLRQERNH